MGSRKDSDALRKAVAEAIESYFAENTDLVSKIAEMVVKKIKDEIEVTVNDKVAPIVEVNKRLVEKVNSLEQINKKDNIRIFGLAESRNENIVQKVIEFFKGKLDVNISANNVICYRNNIRTNAKSKPVTVKFLNHNDKHLVISKRKKLKSTNMFICDDLTARNLSLLKDAQKLLGKSAAWTTDGKVYAFYNGEKLRISNSDMLRQFKRPHTDRVDQSINSLTDGAAKNKLRSNSGGQRHI